MSGLPDFGIVGGGVAGLSLAHWLAGAGARVAVFNRAGQAGIASTAAAGMLSVTAEMLEAPAVMGDLCRRSRALWPAYAAQLEEETGLSVDLRREGTLLIAETAAEAARFKALAETSPDPLSWVEPGGFDALEPGLTPGAHGGVFAQLDGQVDSRRVMASLRLACGRRGVVFLEDAAGVTRLEVSGGRVAGVVMGGRVHAAGTVVLAAGVWSEALLAGVAARPVRPYVAPVKGQLAALQADASAPPLRRVVRAGSCYLVPRSDGRLIVGATSEAGIADTSASEAVRDALLARAYVWLPALRRYPVIETWSGLRPLSAGQLPILGAELAPGVRLLSGHYRNGILLAPISAEIVGRSLSGTLSRGEMSVHLPFLGIDERHEKLMLKAQ